MRIAVFGTGGAGGYFGAQLARVGEEVVFVARGEHLRAIRENGLRIEKRLSIETGIETTGGTRSTGLKKSEYAKDSSEPEAEGFVVRTETTDDPNQIGEVDAVLVGVKAWQVEDAARAMGPMIGSNTIVVPLQNGVDASAVLASVLNVERGDGPGRGDYVLNGLCGTISRVIAPGHILSIGETNFIKFGEFDDRRSERVERLRKALEKASVKVEVPADIEAAVWEKFIFVTPYGGVGAWVGVSGGEVGMNEKVNVGNADVHGTSPTADRMSAVPVGKSAFHGAIPVAGSIRSTPETRRMVETGMEEILAVARARGIKLSDNIVAKTMALLDSLDPNATTSLQRDILAGKPSELEAWTGAVVRLGKESGVATPVNEKIYQRLLPLELRARGLGA